MYKNIFLNFGRGHFFNEKNLKQANKKSLELKQNSNEIKDKIDKLKIPKLNKDSYILSKKDKASFISFIFNCNFNRTI